MFLVVTENGCVLVPANNSGTLRGTGGGPNYRNALHAIGLGGCAEPLDRNLRSWHLDVPVYDSPVSEEIAHFVPASMLINIGAATDYRVSAPQSLVALHPAYITEQ